AGLNKTLKSAQQNARNNPKPNPNARRNEKVLEAQEAVDEAIAKKANNVTKAGIVAGASAESAVDVVEATTDSEQGGGGGGSGKSSPACFVAGTKVKTINGSKNIEDVNSGDTLLTRNEFDGTSEYDIVDLKVVSSSKELYYIATSDSCIFY